MHLHGEGFRTLYIGAASHVGTAIVYQALLGVVPASYATTANVRNVGHEVLAIWMARWSGTTEMADKEVVDLSDQAYKSKLHVLSVWAKCSAGIAWTLKFYDATREDVIVARPLGTAQTTYVDFTYPDRPGATPTNVVGSGRDGDLVIDTSSSASGDEISMVVRLWCE
jgi:hypothetical protein